MPFPIHRMRRLRATEPIRNLVRETRLSPQQFILPLFVCPGEGVKREIGAMPDNYQMSIDQTVKECEELVSLGIGGVILFGLPETKDESASGAYDDQGIVQRAIRAIKQAAPKLLVMTDVCNCEYTSHGHCGFIKDGDVDNDTTLQWLAKSALSHARAGADIVAPSDMMDGRVAAIRQALDANGFVRRQVRQRFLRPVPRSRRIRAAVRRSPQLSDGSRQRTRSHARNRARSRRRRRHDHGEARRPVPRSDLPGARTLRRSNRRVPGE